MHRKNILDLRIADVGITVESDADMERFSDYVSYRDFFGCGKASLRCRLGLAIGEPPLPAPTSDAFDALGNWQIYRRGASRILRIGPPEQGGVPNDLAVFNLDYSEGVIYRKRALAAFGGFVDQFILINLLSHRKGFLFHACGINWQGNGLCFAGPSGAGKSTMMKLFAGDVEKRDLLNDDRVVLRRYGRRWRVFGTPWHGELPYVSPDAAPLKALFFIKHSGRDYVRRLSAADACGRLFVTSLVPIWDAKATARVADMFGDLIRDVPAFELGFRPQKSAVELVKRTVAELSTKGARA